MAMTNPYQNYRNQQIFTASQDKLLLMLFDGAVRFCNQASAALEKKKYDEANTCLVKAQNIIQEFQLTLNMDFEISHKLYALYDFYYRRLIEANIKKDAKIVAEVTDFLSDLRETFATAVARAKAEKQVTTGGADLEI